MTLQNMIFFPTPNYKKIKPIFQLENFVGVKKNIVRLIFIILVAALLMAQLH